MSWGTIDDAEFKAFATKVDRSITSDELMKAVQTSTKRVGTQFMKSVKSRTPVAKYPKGSGRTGGTLRRGWETKGPTLSSKDIVLTMLNNVEYAEYVESGHRTRGGGWVPGKHMLMKAMFEIDDQITALLTPTLQNYLTRLI